MHTPIHHLSSIETATRWSTILDNLETGQGHYAVIRRKTTTMELVPLHIHDLFRSTLGEPETTPVHIRRPALTRVDWTTVTDPHIALDANIARLELSAIQTRVRVGGLHVTVLRHTRPVAVCIPNGWATRARETLAHAAQRAREQHTQRT